MNSRVFDGVKILAGFIAVVFVGMVMLSIWNVIGHFAKDWLPPGLALTSYVLAGIALYKISRAWLEEFRFAGNKVNDNSKTYGISILLADSVVILLGVIFVAVDYLMNRFDIFSSIDERVRNVLFGSIWVLYVVLILATFGVSYVRKTIYKNKPVPTGQQAVELITAVLCVIGNAIGTYHAVEPLAGWASAIGMAVLTDLMILVMIVWSLEANDDKTKSYAARSALAFIFITSVVQVINGVTYIGSIASTDIENIAWFAFPLTMLCSVGLILLVGVTDYLNGGMSFGSKQSAPQMAKPQSAPPQMPRPVPQKPQMDERPRQPIAVYGSVDNDGSDPNS